jgi:hypothetical protein
MQDQDAVVRGDGLCGCGCGSKTKIATVNNPKRGLFKGRPLRFVWGHASRTRTRPVEHWFELYVYPDPNTGCFIWAGPACGTYGHGACQFEGRRQPAHRVAWILERGAIPAGLEVMHKCRQSCCVNVDHLELGTHAENMREIFARDGMPLGKYPRGVKRCRNKFHARFFVPGHKDVHLGAFATVEEAAAAAAAERAKYYPPRRQ